MRFLPPVLVLVAAGCGSTSAEVEQAVDPPARARPTVTGAAASLSRTPRSVEVGSENPLEARYGRHEPVRTMRGRASFYHDSLAGNCTANGDYYSLTDFTAASRDLPFGTVVRVVRPDNGSSVIVRVNDRGPFNDRRRILDLSRAAASALDMLASGVVDVRAEILEMGDGSRRRCQR